MSLLKVFKRTSLILLAFALAYGFLCVQVVEASNCPEGIGDKHEGPPCASFGDFRRATMRMKEFIEEHKVKFCCGGQKADDGEDVGESNCKDRCPAFGGRVFLHWNEKIESIPEAKERLDQINALKDQINTIKDEVKDEVDLLAADLKVQVETKREEIKGIADSYKEQIKAKLDELPDEYKRCGMRSCIFRGKCKKPGSSDETPDEVKAIYEAVQALREEMKTTIEPKAEELKALREELCGIWKDKLAEAKTEIDLLKDQIKALWDEIKEIVHSQA